MLAVALAAPLPWSWPSAARHIAVCDLNPKTARETAQQVRALGRNASVHQVDVANRQQMQMLPAKVLKA